MKKILAIILSLTTAVLTSVGLVACGKKDPIDYTAEKPLIMSRTQVDERLTTDCRLYKSYDFEDFSNYYSTNYKGEGLFLLSYGFEIMPWLVGHPYQICEIYNELTFQSYIVHEKLTIFDKELGSTPVKGETGFFVSIEIDIYIKPIAEYENQSFAYEFGKEYSNGYGHKYVNIYAGEECFATCFYYDTTQSGVIEEEWFENHFNENLVWGDSL